jgi:hypothetical protein
MTGIKHDNEKPMMDLLPMAALTEVGKVLTEGSKKYSRHNWRHGFKYSRLQAALLRHYSAFSEGEDHDPETKLLHLAHLTCCALFLLEHQVKGYGEDDRYATGVGHPAFPQGKSRFDMHHMEHGLQGEKNG